MNTLEVKNAIAKPITESMYVGEKDRTTILANVESYLIENRILFPAPEEVNRLVGEVLSKIREEKKEKARKNELDQLLWNVLWKPLGLPRDTRKSFKLNNPQIELLLVSSPSWDSYQQVNIWSTKILHGMESNFNKCILKFYQMTSDSGVFAVRPSQTCGTSCARYETFYTSNLKNSIKMADSKFTFKDFVEGIAGAFHIAAALITPFLRHWRIMWGATDAEVHRSLPGDDFVPHPKWGWTHAITIRADR